MYCSSCGAAVAQGLNYCKRCGTKLGVTKGEELTTPAEPPPESLVWAMVVVFIVGLGATIGLMAVMKQVLDFNPGLIIGITLLSFLLMCTIEGVFIWLLMGGRRGAKEVSDLSRLKEQMMKELGESQKPGLPEPTPSVAEHTTRSFESVYSEPKSK
jgi:hypothetical protein